VITQSLVLVVGNFCFSGFISELVVSGFVA
jgi:hypothetical protein